jgi:hypothetical protein
MAKTPGHCRKPNLSHRKSAEAKRINMLVTVELGSLIEALYKTGFSDEQIKKIIALIMQIKK